MIIATNEEDKEDQIEESFENLQSLLANTTQSQSNERKLKKKKNDNNLQQNKRQDKLTNDGKKSQQKGKMSETNKPNQQKTKAGGKPNIASNYDLSKFLTPSNRPQQGVKGRTPPTPPEREGNKCAK